MTQKSDQRNSRGIGFIGAGMAPKWALVGLVVFAVGTVWLRLWIVRTSYAVSQVDSRIRNLQRERDQSELKLASSRSPRKLEAIARSQYGLSQPRADQLVMMK